MCVCSHYQQVGLLGSLLFGQQTHRLTVVGWAQCLAEVTEPQTTVTTTATTIIIKTTTIVTTAATTTITKPTETEIKLKVQNKVACLFRPRTENHKAQWTLSEKEIEKERGEEATICCSLDVAGKSRELTDFCVSSSSCSSVLFIRLTL